MEEKRKLQTNDNCEKNERRHEMLEREVTNRAWFDDAGTPDS
jgi:hypothetical protein